MRLGDTFLNLNPGSPEHLWIVITDPEVLPFMVIVNLTSYRFGCDDTCRVVAGEHSFVSRDSVVAFERAQLLTPQQLQFIEGNGHCRMHEPVTAELIGRIQQGVIASEFTPQKVRSIVEEYLRIAPSLPPPSNGV